MDLAKPVLVRTRPHLQLFRPSCARCLHALDDADAGRPGGGPKLVQVVTSCSRHQCNMWRVLLGLATKARKFHWQHAGGDWKFSVRVCRISFLVYPNRTLQALDLKPCTPWAGRKLKTF